MNKRIWLSACLILISGCASDPKPAATAQEVVFPNVDKIRVGMPRTEVEQILGNPTSVTDSAAGTTEVWVFGAAAAKATPAPSSNRHLYSQLGSIAATTAGIFIPYVGIAGNLGAQVYNLSNAGSGNDDDVNKQQAINETRIVTVEFRDNKVFSIQRAKPVNFNLPPSPVPAPDQMPAPTQSPAPKQITTPAPNPVPMPSTSPAQVSPKQ